MTDTPAPSSRLNRRSLLGFGIVGAALAAGAFQALDFRPGYAGGNLLVADAHAQAEI